MVHTTEATIIRREFEMERKETCFTCKFSIGGATICRRYPPVPMGVGGADENPKLLCPFPETYANNWCGEYKRVGTT